MVDPGMALVSIVVPLFNEELNLQLLHDGLTLALQQMLRLYEIVYVAVSYTHLTLPTKRIV